ncbi:ankyrin repeat-containing domain protein [Xylaria arbuscula]|nr:ankyrin repeat-containing domain protein [Xylaria arbuscula]
MLHNITTNLLVPLTAAFVRRSALLRALMGKSQDIWSAARIGDIDYFEDVLQKRDHLRRTDKGRDSLLTVAAQHGQLELCQYLVRCGYGIFHAGNEAFPSKTALGAAIETRNKELFDLLISLAHEDEIRDFTDGDALTAHYAAAINSGEREFIDAIFTLILTKEDHIDFDDLFYHIAKYPPARHADASEVYDALRAVVENYNAWESLSGPKLKTGGNYVMLACCSKNPNVLSFLLQHTSPEEWYATDHKYKRPPIFAAILYGSIECVQLLFKHAGTEIMEHYDGEVNGPLHLVCEFGNDRIIEMLNVVLPYSMSHLNDRNADGNTL